MKSKILIDTLSLLSPLTGIGRYTNEITRNINETNDYDLTFFYGYYSHKLLEPTSQSNLKKKIVSQIVKNPFIKKIVRKIIILSSKNNYNKYDLYWQPNFIPNLQVDAKIIVTTIHDFSFILHTEFHPEERVKYFQENFLDNISKSDVIITVSHFVKQEILNRLEFKEKEIRVIYNGVNHNIFKIYNNTQLPFDLPNKFILSVGSIEPRKNLLGLLKAYNLLNKETKDIYKLVLVGFKGWQNQEFMELLEKNKTNIIYLGFISDEQLAKVYNRATCFVFPSFYEGFGLPLLESMACGTPVITSNLSALPEVGSDAAIYSNPYNIEDIKDKIELLLNDVILQQNMISKGLERVKEFTWEQSAQKHIKLFEELI